MNSSDHLREKLIRMQKWKMKTTDNVLVVHASPKFSPPLRYHDLFEVSHFPSSVQERFTNTSGNCKNLMKVVSESSGRNLGDVTHCMPS